MNPLQQEHGNWANKQFRSHYKPDGSPNPLPPWHHLIDDDKGEVWELGTALLEGDTYKIATELADCQLLLYSIAHLCGIDIEAAAWEKYRLNCCRKWGEPDENGIVEHIGEADAAIAQPASRDTADICWDLTFVVNGRPILIRCKPSEHLHALKERALDATQNIGQPPNNWEIRNAMGTLLNEVKSPLDYMMTSNETLFLNLRAGWGGQ